MVDVCQRARSIRAPLCHGAWGQSCVTPLIPPGLKLGSPLLLPSGFGLCFGFKCSIKADPALDSPCLCWKLVASSDLSTHKQSCNLGLSSFICGPQVFGFEVSPRGVQVDLCWWVWGFYKLNPIPGLSGCRTLCPCLTDSCASAHPLLLPHPFPFPCFPTSSLNPPAWPVAVPQHAFPIQPRSQGQGAGTGWLLPGLEEILL